MTVPEDPLIDPGAISDLLRFPLLQAIFGRRSRRFGVGMEIPSGPLAFASRAAPYPLSDLEAAILVAAGTGVSGWSFGVPFSPSRPTQHANLTERFTGRTSPTAAGIGTPVLFYTTDDGTYVTNTRDVVPGRVRERLESEGDAERIISVCRDHTVRVSSARLELPPAPPHMLEPNIWMANAPGSMFMMPISEASEEFLGLLAIFVAHGYLIVDDEARRPAGDLAPFLRSGLLNEDKIFPLSVLQHLTYEANCTEVAFMAHNMALTMQAMGLGGLYYTGLNRWSILGAFAEQGIDGLGFRFVHDERWTVPDPVGLDGVFEALCPPYYPDMRAAVKAFVERKFGPGGAYDPGVSGPWKRAAEIKRTVEPYSEEFVDCLGEIAQYVHDKHGKFPGTLTTLVLPGFIQAHHIDTEFYDAHYLPGAYLEAHANHMQRWHGGGTD
jgi:hypothetical protein